MIVFSGCILFIVVCKTPCTLKISRLSDVQQSLREAKFRESEWLDLGDQLRLHPSTLDVIENNHRNDTSRCLREVLRKWLEGADGVSATWSTLVKAIEDIGQQAVAEHISELKGNYIIVFICNMPQDVKNMMHLIILKRKILAAGQRKNF